jgi:hypothetical protein
MARTPASPPPQVQPLQAVAPPPQVQPAPMAHPVTPLRQPSLLEAIAAASAGFGDLTKDSDNTYHKSKYLKLPGLLKAIKQPLLDQGVVVYSQAMCLEGAWLVRTTLAFVDGREEMYSDFPITDISILHKIGGSFTYGTRYNLFALLAVCPEDDDDGNSGGYNAPAPAVAQLPGLPGGVGVWPAPGQQVQAPMAVFPQQPYQQPPMAAMPVNPVQPLPVLQ